jgi:phosphoglycolate phosphatase-like HAD superfamily hydrolase
MSKFGFVFDLDGTLVDSRNQIQTSLDKARTNSQLPTAPLDFVQSQLGLPVENLFSDLSLQAPELQGLIQSFRDTNWSNTTKCLSCADSHLRCNH